MDVWKEGDEFYSLHFQEWRAATILNQVENTDLVGRRRITIPEPAGWISVQDRLPTEKEQDQFKILLASKEGTVCLSTQTIMQAAFWMIVPPVPEPTPDPDEEAWEEWDAKNLIRSYSVNNSEADRAMKEGFLAGRRSVARKGGQDA